MSRGSRHMPATRFAALMLAVMLAGCSSAHIGASSFGNNSLKVAEISGLGDYTSERALHEARGHFRNGNYGHSAALYRRAVELSPKDPEGYIGLGASYDRLRRFDLSDRVYTSLHAITGGTAQYYNNVGYSQLLRGNLREAHSNFRRAEKLDPGNVVVVNNLQILARVAARTRA